MEYTEIREIIQSEYEKQTTDTNYNFIARFAKAVYEAQEQANKNFVQPDVSGNEAIQPENKKDGEVAVCDNHHTDIIKRKDGRIFCFECKKYL